MRWSQSVRRRSSGFGKRSRRALASAIDLLESRRLFSGETLSTPISNVLAHTSGPATDSITLNQHFFDEALPGTVVTFKTNLGTITVSLTDAATPLTVANFLSYVNSGAYTDTIFHRSAVLAAGTGGSPSAPADIIQGGGYVVQGTGFTHIPTSAPVDDEYTKAILNDSAGTLSMAKTSDANSATSEWYFNVHDDVSALDTPTTDSNGVSTSYTAFGKVLTGMNVIDEIAALPTYNASNANSALNTLPVLGLTEKQATKGEFPLTSANLVYTESITSQPGVNYTVTSDNNSLVTPKITDGVLSFTYAPGASGTAEITVTAKSLDGTSATTTFAVTVPNSATPSAGPTTANITAPDVVAGTTADVSVLGSDTDSVAALDPSTVTIVTQPSHGTATVDTTNGHIKYTPTAGYTGTDTLIYTVSDTAGTVSPAATVSLNVVTAPVTVTLGTKTARSLTFTEPSGVVGHLSIGGGTAVVTFSPGVVTTTTAGGVVTATGSGATVSSIVITNTGAAASLSLTASGAVSLGTITDSKAVSIIDAPNATLTGSSSFARIGRLILAGATDANLSLGSGIGSSLIIPNLLNTTITDTGSIQSIIAKQWQTSGGGYYTLSAPAIGRLNVSGEFDDVLNLSSKKTSLASAIIGTASAAWTILGSVGTAAFGSPASTFSLGANGSVGRLIVAGNLTNTITASTFGLLRVTGSTTGATLSTTSSKAAVAIGKLTFGGAVASTTVTTFVGGIGVATAASLDTTQINVGSIGTLRVVGTTTGTTIKAYTAFAAGSKDIGRLIFDGGVTTSVINSAGNIGSIAAPSLTNTHVFAGASASLIDAPALPASTTDFAADARIGSVVLGKAAGAFSNSLIIADLLGTLHLGQITSANTGVAFGVGAHEIHAVAGTLVPGGTIKAGPAQLKSATTLSKYETAKKLALGDFKITLV
jgi:cyclophilin family peptidyl-prolyl cis-trans isomerase